MSSSNSNGSSLFAFAAPSSGGGAAGVATMNGNTGTTSSTANSTGGGSNFYSFPIMTGSMDNNNLGSTNSMNADLEAALQQQLQTMAQNNNNTSNNNNNSVVTTTVPSLSNTSANTSNVAQTLQQHHKSQREEQLRLAQELVVHILQLVYNTTSFDNDNSNGSQSQQQTQSTPKEPAVDGPLLLQLTQNLMKQLTAANAAMDQMLLQQQPQQTLQQQPTSNPSLGVTNDGLLGQLLQMATGTGGTSNGVPASVPPSSNSNAAANLMMNNSNDLGQLLASLGGVNNSNTPAAAPAPQQQQQTQDPMQNLLLSMLTGGSPPPQQQQQPAMGTDANSNNAIAALLSALQQAPNNTSSANHNGGGGGGGVVSTTGSIFPTGNVSVVQPQSQEQQQHSIREVNVYPMANIESPGPHDVVMGRGRGASGHIGNVNFRAFIKLFKPKYAAANRIDKPKVAGEVVAKWREKNPPGRFLAQIRTTNRNVWNDVGDRKARQKTSQSLREREVIRKSHRRSRKETDSVSSSADESGTGGSESDMENDDVDDHSNAVGGGEDGDSSVATNGSRQRQATMAHRIPTGESSTSGDAPSD